MKPAVETKMQAVRLIGAAWGLGASDPGCADGPVHLQNLDIVQQLETGHIPAFWATVMRPGPGQDAIPTLCKRLAGEVTIPIQLHQPFAVIGGDHSCAIGTWQGVADGLGRPPGLIWIDAHMDAHTPETTETGAVNGMPLAALLGHGSRTLTRLGTILPALQVDSTCLIGVHSYEAAEAALLEELGVRVFFMEEVRSRGIHEILAEALEQVTRHHSEFGVSLDLDAIDPLQAPGVGTPVAGGIDAGQLIDAVRTLDERKHLLGVEIAELNPHRDRDDRTAQLVVPLLTSFFARSREDTR